MMAMPCMVVSSVKPVKKPARGKTSIRERVVTYEGSSGPRELLEAIVIQAQAAIKGLEGFKEPEKNPEDMTEEEKRMTAEDRKGKAKEIDTHAEENTKLLKFWCAHLHCPACTSLRPRPQRTDFGHCRCD